MSEEQFQPPYPPKRTVVSTTDTVNVGRTDSAAGNPLQDILAAKRPRSVADKKP
ncbi:MAG: hypothetical protein PHT00_05440 [Candidatus Methanomethylophilus sp.]|nr:hypothetical protein [Methanomethylophilus sp.]MDD3233588.1 hypothetical protein [Methanomethylophilus sp.]MDD4222686.1 hypothetical protein [Methanomethylophilus sp.]MDD4669347.1 hypothetical protein [Methanomethylophilus sp.]